MQQLARTLTAAVAIALMCLWTDAHAGLQITGKPKVSFHAEGSPGFLTFEGVTKEISLVDDGEKLVFTVPMDTVQTGIALRDDHMRRNYVETDKYPTVVLTILRDQVSWPAPGGVTEGRITAPFLAHGVTVEIPVEFEIRSQKTGYRVKASFPFNSSNHGIAIPQYLGVTIKPDMRAEVLLDLVEG